MTTAGIYVHTPFCRRRCPFCDFAITTDLGGFQDWEEALGREIALRGRRWNVPFDTLYFGGGTPSLLPAATLGRLVVSLRRHFDVAEDAETTIEANPGDLDERGFAALRRVGFNRLSLGVQSFDDSELLFLGRDHTAEDSEAAFQAARRAGFENISVDLIYGLPEQSLGDWRAQMRHTAELGPEHVSAYMLTFEPGTPLTRRKERGEFQELSEPRAREYFLTTGVCLAELGYRAYEVSSFARSGQVESRHNWKYWRGAPYLGLGPSAHSYRDPRRSWNYPRLKEYCAALARHRVPTAGSEILGRREKWLERLFLGLRTIDGVRLQDFEEEFGHSLEARRGPVLERLLAQGLARRSEDRLALTPEGLAVADGIAVELAW